MIGGRDKDVIGTEQIITEEMSIGGPQMKSRSDWDDGRWEWQDTPRREDRDSHSVSRRHQHPSPSPMMLGASPDARLVSPWLDGNTPCSAVSPWDHISPSVPIRAWGSSKRASDLRQVGISHQLTFSAASSSKDNEAGKNSLAGGDNYEITEEMRQEMDYNADRAWYDREEHNTMFDDSSSLFHGDETSYQKKEAELAKKLVHWSFRRRRRFQLIGFPLLVLSTLFQHLVKAI